MKKISLLFFAALFLFTGSFPASSAFAASAAKQISVLVDGIPVVFDVPPVAKNGRVMVPFKAVADALNVGVTWDGKKQMVLATNSKTKIQLQLNGLTAYRNGEAIKLDAAPFALKGRTLVPLSFFASSFDSRVEWDGGLQQVRIYTAPSTMDVIGFYGLGSIEKGTSSWTDLFQQDYPNPALGNTDMISKLAFCWYYMDQNGNFMPNNKYGWQKPDKWETVPAAAKQYTMKTEMTVYMADGTGELTALMADEQAKARAIANIVQEARNFQGVHIDFEGLGLANKGVQKVRDTFTAFIRELSGQLKAENLTLSVTLHPLNSSYNGYDYAALGKLVDQIVIMAYDYNPQSASPEPDDKVMQAVRLAKQIVPKEKLLLGINVAHENPKTIINKVGIAKRNGIGGIAVWRLGLLSDDMWEALRSTLRAEK